MTLDIWYLDLITKIIQLKNDSDAMNNNLEILAKLKNDFPRILSFTAFPHSRLLHCMPF